MTEQVRFDPQTGEILEDEPPAAAKPALALVENQQPLQPAPAPVARPPRTKKKRSRVEETKRQRFERVATGRYLTIVKALQVLGKMSGNRSQYEYGDSDLERLRSRLQVELDETMARLKGKRAPQQVRLFD